MAETLQPQGATDGMRSAAANAGSTVTEKAKELADTPMGSKAQDAASAAQEKGKEAASSALDQVKTQLDTRSTTVGEGITSFAGAARQASQQMREEGKDGPAQLVDKAADRVEGLGSYLTQADGDTLMRDVEDFARRQPMVFAVGGVAMGFLAARFLRASSERRYAQHHGHLRHSGLETGYATGNQSWLEDRVAKHSDGQDLPSQVR